MAITAEKITKPGTVSLQQKTGARPAKQPFFAGTKTPSFFAPAVKANYSGGTALPAEAREYFKSSLQADVSDIRIHNDYNSLLSTRSKGVRGYADGADIFFNPSAYAPESEAGGVLLARLVAESLKQRSLSVPDLEQQLSEGIEDLAKGDERAAPRTQTQISTDQTAGRKHKGAKGRSQNKKQSAKKTKGRKAKGRNDAPVFRTKKKDPKRSPQSPEEDPAFHRVVRKTSSTAKKARAHGPAELKSAAAQKAAKAVAKEAESRAQNRKTDSLGKAGKEDRPFKAAGFKKDLLHQITEITPKTLKEATEFKENNKISSVKQIMGSKVAEEKAASTGPVDKAAEQPLNVLETDNKTAIPLPALARPGKPAAASPADSAPKPKLAGEISLKEQSISVDEEMRANNVTEDQLLKSNEPTFISALDAKKSAQKDAAQKPAEYRKQEALLLTAAKSEAGTESSKAMTGLQLEQMKNQTSVDQQQQTAKNKDEERRAVVARTVDELFKSAEAKVTSALAAADREANTIFDNGSEAAKKVFEEYVDQKMRSYKARRYSGFWGRLRWAKDKFFGMRDEVNIFYTEGRKLYLSEMDKVITQVANAVTTRLNDAKQAIRDGKSSIDKYVNALPTDLAEVGKNAADSIQDRFDTLEQNVNDKRDQLIDGLAKKYIDNVKKLDDRINEMKEANKGLINKAIGYLKKVWEVIKNLKELFTSILSKLASIIGTILSSPGKFFSNLGRAFQQGLDNFKAGFAGYLETGLMSWLAATLGVPGVELPGKFSPGALFTLALQVMGITKVKIRERAVELLDEEKVGLLETTGGVIHKIYDEGPASIWDMIVEKLSDFKEIVWEAIKSYITKTIIEAAVVFLLSMLSPIGAFIKVCMAIYDFLMTLVRFKDRIVDLLDSVLGAVTSIASGAIDSAAKAIERAFAKSIPVIIAFLAALLHLNSIAAKVRDIITRIQKRVEKGIDFVFLKGWSMISKGFSGMLKVKNKGREMLERGKDFAVATGKKAVGAVAGWLGMKKHFKLANGEDHEIYFAGSAVAPEVMVASARGISVQKLVNQRRKRNPLPTQQQNDNLTLALSHKTELDAFILQNNNPAPGGGTATRNIDGQISTRLEIIKVHLLAGDAIHVAGQDLPLTNITYQMSNGKAGKVVAEPLTKLPGNTKGSVPGKTVIPGWPYVKTLSESERQKWRRVHLINENLHGPGTIWNLVPGDERLNSSMKVGIEKDVKEAVESGGTFYLHVEVSGWYQRDNPLVSDYFPMGVEAVYGRLPDASKGEKYKTVIKKVNYQADDPLRAGPPSINAMTEKAIKLVFKDVFKRDLIYETRNALMGRQYLSLIHLYTALKTAYKLDDAEFDSRVWSPIAHKFNFENAFAF